MKLTIIDDIRTRKQPSIVLMGRIIPSTARSKNTPATSCIRDSRLPVWDLRFAKPMVVKIPPIPTMKIPEAISGRILAESTVKEGSKAKGDIMRQQRAVVQKAIANSE